MDQFRRIFATIQRHLGGMTATQRLLVLCLGVIVAMSLFFVAQYAGRPDREALPSVRPTAEVMTVLAAAGLSPRAGPEGVTVPVGQRDLAIAELSQSGELPNDTIPLFQNLGSKWDWRFSREQNRQQSIFALQNELSRVLEKFRGVRSASVILDVPEAAGLGRASRSPTGSVTIVTDGAAMSQAQVDAVASLVAGAVSGLPASAVEVIDANANRTRRASSEDDAVAATYMEHRERVERAFRERLEAHLAYIPGVMVTVTADVDVTRVSQQTKRHLEKGQGTVSLPKRDSSSSLNEQNAVSAAEPGIRSNQGADLNTSPSSGGTSVEQSEADTEFDNLVGTEVVQTVDPRGVPTYLAVSVNVPEGFVGELVKRERAAAAAAGAGGADPAAPASRAELDARFADLRAQIEGSLRPLLRTRTAEGGVSDGAVNVAMVPVDLPLATAGQSAGLLGLIAGGGGGAGGLLGGGGMIDTVLVAGTALVALGMMVMLVRRSGKKLELPSAEELVGVPAVIDLDGGELVGEAGEGERPMTGIEIGEEDVLRQNMLEQVKEMVSSDPKKAAQLLTRWMAVEER